MKTRLAWLLCAMVACQAPSPLPPAVRGRTFYPAVWADDRLPDLNQRFHTEHQAIDIGVEAGSSLTAVDDALVLAAGATTLDCPRLGGPVEDRWIILRTSRRGCE